MSTLETNSIGKYSGNNVSVDDALNLKSYDTAGRDALTSVAGDTIYNETTEKVEYYTGSAWVETGASSFEIEYLIIAGGASGGATNGAGGGGGGAGGYLNSYASETSGGNASTAEKFSVFKSTNITVSVGGGGTGLSGSTVDGNSGTNSRVDFIVALGGGGGAKRARAGVGGGSGGGGGAQVASRGGTGLQGFDGGAVTQTGSPYPTGGGGGAGAVGVDGTSSGAGNGGAGLSSSITGSPVARAGGGGGANFNGVGGTGGTGGGGTGSGNTVSNGTAGTINTGSGGGGAGSSGTSGAGGSGIVILRWATADATIGATRTGLVDGNVQTSGSDSYIVFTGGEGDITFS